MGWMWLQMYSGLDCGAMVTGQLGGAGRPRHNLSRDDALSLARAAASLGRSEVSTPPQLYRVLARLDLHLDWLQFVNRNWQGGPCS